MLKPTPEQTAVIDFVRDRTENLLVTAYAGAAKTSTLVMAAHEAKVPSRAIAFNKAIAQEMSERMPPHVECKTLHSLGLESITAYLGKRPKVDMNKRRDMLKAAINAHARKNELWEAYADMLKGIANGCAGGYVPSKCEGMGIIDDDEFLAGLPFEYDSDMADIMIEVSRQAIKRGREGVVDFDDMVLFPVIFRTPVTPRPLTYVDEAQDLSVLNHKFITRLVGKNRLVAVGDSCQAIYAFRGADAKSISKLRNQFNMTELRLTTTFRCDKAIVEHVRWRAPDIMARPGAGGGSVERKASWHPDDIEDGAAIVCRNNAPLFGTALYLLEHGRRPQVRGDDITKGLVREMKKFGPPALASEDAFKRIEEWEAANLRKYKNAHWVSDKAQCFRMFFSAADTLAGAIAAAEAVMVQEGPIQLMTGHKAKGLEFDTVYFLDRFLIRDEDAPTSQEANLRYVIATRARHRLVYINSGDKE